jgi:hypothetical protein
MRIEPKGNSRPLGESSPNLITLLHASGSTVGKKLIALNAGISMNYIQFGEEESDIKFDFEGHRFESHSSERESSLFSLSRPPTLKRIFY